MKTTELVELPKEEKLELFEVEELESRFEMAEAGWFDDLIVNVGCSGQQVK